MRRLELLLRARLGNFVPKERRFLLSQDWSRTVGDYTIEAIQCDNPTIQAEVSQYARDTFYKEAVVPLSLGLWKHDKGADSIFEREMDLYLNSGMSFVARSNDSGQLVGCFFSCYWPRDHNYDAIRGYTMGEWHKVAAKIAMDVCQERPEPLWRDLQYQHIYNECQITLAETQQDFCVYFGPGYIVPEARGLRIPEKSFGQELGRLIIVNSGIWMAMPTLEALRNRRSERRYTKELDHVNYEDQILATNEGKMVFGGITDKGGMTLKMSDMSKQPLVRQAFIAIIQVLMRVPFGRVIVRCIGYLETLFRTN